MIRTVAQGRVPDESLRPGDSVEAVGTLWGLLSWYEGLLYQPAEGLLLEASEIPIAPGSGAKDAIMRMDFGSTSQAVNAVSWLRPSHRSSEWVLESCTHAAMRRENRGIQHCNPDAHGLEGVPVPIQHDIGS